MSEKLFRKTSLDRVNAPEQLNEYIRVARPGVWVLLAAITLMLIGVLFWGVFGNIESSFTASAVVRGGVATAYITEEEAAFAQVGMQVRIGDSAGTVASLSDAPTPLDALADEALLTAGVFDPNKNYYAVAVDIAGVPDGVYIATIVQDNIQPIKFVVR